MSFWAATVITNFLTVISMVGERGAQWLWGGFNVGKGTLSRFFTLHFLIPFPISLQFNLPGIPSNFNPNVDRPKEWITLIPVIYIFIHLFQGKIKFKLVSTTRAWPKFNSYPLRR